MPKIRKTRKPAPTLPDRRAQAMQAEAFGQAIAPEFYALAGMRPPVREPFYLHQLGLHREPFATVPPYQPGPVIRRRA